MAATLKISSLDGYSYADLLAGTLKLEAESWQTRTAQVVSDYTHGPYGAQPAFRHYAPVVEQIDLVARDSGANITAAIATLDGYLAAARRWHTTRHEPGSYWLHHAAAGETAARRALIYEGSLKVMSGVGLDPMLTNAAARLQLQVTRHPLWEAAAGTVQTAENKTLWGSKWTLSSVAGNEPARIRDLAVKPRFGGGGPLVRIWIGLREQGSGTANFDPVWELEDGSNEATAADVADATASPDPATGSKVQVAFNVTATMAQRMSITVSQAAIRYGHMNYSHYTGNYHVLLRCKVTAGATVKVELRIGYTNSASTVPVQEEWVTNSDWRLIPMGYISIPHHGYRDQLAANANVATTQLQVWAGHEAGTAATDVLDLDAIQLIPSDHFARLEGTDVEYRVSDDTPAHIFVFEDDTDLPVGYRYGKPSLNLPPDLNDFYLPVGQPAVVIAAERQASHVLTDANDLRLEYLPRWLAYRSS